MVHCVAFGCHERSEDGNKGFFLFPKDVLLKKKWVAAVGSCREIGGRIVAWKPTNASRLCKRHFRDDDYVHSPEVMKSVGIELKLQLKKTAVPSIFPEIDEFKENQKPLRLSALGSVKRKRDVYGTFEKRNRMQIVSKIVEEYDVAASTEDSVEITIDLTSISETTYHDSGLVSQAVQTEPCHMEHKSFQVHPTTRDMCVGFSPHMSHQAVGPDSIEWPPPVVKAYQFPAEDCDTDDLDYESEEVSDMEDGAHEDPDWYPDSDVSSDEEIEEDWEEHGYVSELGSQFWLVAESAILQILLWCHICGSMGKVVRKFVRGAMLSVTTLCSCGHSQTWDSMACVRGTPEVNLVGSGAVTFSGASISKVLNIFKFMKVPFVTSRTFHRIQRGFILPAIESVWKTKQAAILEECSSRQVKAGGDARCCSPGHSAKYGSYTIMDMETGQVLAVELVQSNEVKNSNAMELEGLKRALETLDDNGVTISDLTTDRHLQVRKFLREQRSDINHWFDGWHLARNVKSKLVALGKKKGCQIVSKWAHSISNFLYYCAATSGGDGDLVQDKWLSILNHVTNKHEGHGGRFPKCQHEKIEREWIRAGSKSHKELEFIIARKRLLGDIKKLSPAEQTSKLEAQHKVVCQFAPKFYSFSYRVMEKRLYLAALHTSCNANKKQAVTKDGVPQFKVSYPKYKAGLHVVKPVTEAPVYDYVDDLMKELVHLRKRHRSYNDAEQSYTDQLTSPPPLSSSAHKVSKEKAIEDHKTRFAIAKKFCV